MKTLCPVEMYRTQATASLFAYDLGVEQTGPAIYREVLKRQALLDVGPPQSVDPRTDEYKAWRAARESIQKMKYPISRSNSYYLMLAGKRPPSKKNLRLIKILSRISWELYHHPFWDIYSNQPTTHNEYFSLSHYLQFPSSQNCPRFDISEKLHQHPDRPPDRFLKDVALVDSINSLAYFLLLLGASHSLNWTDLYHKSIANIIDIGCRLITTIPYAVCGEAFIVDILESATAGRAAPLSNIRDSIRSKFRFNIQIIRSAKKHRILDTIMAAESIKCWDGLSLLRHIDELDNHAFTRKLLASENRSDLARLRLNFIKMRIDSINSKTYLY